MSEQKYTPGPWVAVPDWTYDRLEIRDKDGRRIAICTKDFPMSTATHDANADLIAAAPELLAALEAANRFITNGLEYGYIDLEKEDTSGMHTIDAIRQAIRKTKGWMES